MTGRPDPRGNDPPMGERWPGNGVTRPHVDLRSSLVLRNERLAVDLRVGHAKQAGLQTNPGLTGLVPVLEGEGFRVQIAERESDKHLQVALHGRLEFTHSGLCFPPGHGTLEMSVLDIAYAPAQGGNGDAEKRGSPLLGHLPDTAEIADTGGMKIEIFRSFVVGHNVYSLQFDCAGATLP